MLKPLRRDDTLNPDSIMEARFAILEAALHRLETVCEPGSIRRAAVRLATLLHTHYEFEEDPSNFFNETQGLGSYPHRELSCLRKEHGPILATLEELGQAAGLSSPELRSRALEIIAKIRDHEAREAQAYFEGLYTDLGGQG